MIAATERACAVFRRDEWRGGAAGGGLRGRYEASRGRREEELEGGQGVGRGSLRELEQQASEERG